MNSRTRAVIIAALLVLLIGLITGAVAYRLGVPAALANRVGPLELTYLPADTALVAYADVRGIARSEVRQKLGQRLSDTPLNQLHDEVGVDLERDIDHLVVGLEPHGAGPATGVTLARGRFDEQKIEALAREHAGHVDSVGARRLIVLSATGNADPAALAFPETGVMAFGSQAMVRQLLEAPRSAPNVTSNPEIVTRIRALQPSDLWAVGRIDQLRGDGRLPAGIASQIPALTWFSVSGHVDASVRAEVSAEARDDAAAADLRDVIRGVIGLARLQGSRSGLRNVVDSVKLTGSGPNVVVSFAIPAETFNTITEQRK